MEKIKVSVIGDGLAGLTIAQRLAQDGSLQAIYGNGQSNTPPVALLHLFAGRSFRRDSLEVQAFKQAVSFWGALPELGERFQIRRLVQPQSRLAKSLDQAPAGFIPSSLGLNWLEYGPGFSINTAKLEKNLRQTLKPYYCRQTINPDQVEGLKILATGAKASLLFPNLPWDASSGRLVIARTSLTTRNILIGLGLHLAPYPKTGDNCQLEHSLVLGGRFSASGQELGDELELANELLELAYATKLSPKEKVRLKSHWSGERLSLIDHRPVIGPVDQKTIAFFGFGTRALFWIPYCLELTLAALKERSSPIPNSLSFKRFTCLAPL